MFDTDEQATQQKKIKERNKEEHFAIPKIMTIHDLDIRRFPGCAPYYLLFSRLKGTATPQPCVFIRSAAYPDLPTPGMPAVDSKVFLMIFYLQLNTCTITIDRKYTKYIDVYTGV